MTLPEHYETDTLFFFSSRPESLELYQALFAGMDARFTTRACDARKAAGRQRSSDPGCSVKVQKTQISFYSPRLFAMVSLPRRKTERGLVLTLGLGRRLDSPRAAAATEPYPGRWTHHFPITDACELDAELFDFIDEALRFSREKRRLMP